MATKRKSIITDDVTTCFICGRPASDIHHCLHGTANRRWADKYDLVVGLCQACHMGVHDKGINDEILKMAAQTAFEKKCGSRIEFINIFGKNYL